jgi:hypothetical protein|tara:strand:+ start:300 stop:527 length:228 start_codon:yes stop_codon:yes gene_type:complete
MFRAASRCRYKAPSILATIWYAAFSVYFFFGIIAPMLFNSLETILAFILISFNLYKSRKKEVAPPSIDDEAEEAN